MPKKFTKLGEKNLGSSVRFPSVRFGSKFEYENWARSSLRFENWARSSSIISGLDSCLTEMFAFCCEILNYLVSVTETRSHFCSSRARDTQSMATTTAMVAKAVKVARRTRRANIFGLASSCWSSVSVSCHWLTVCHLTHF